MVQIILETFGSFAAVLVGCFFGIGVIVVMAQILNDLKGRNREHELREQITELNIRHGIDAKCVIVESDLIIEEPPVQPPRWKE